MSEGHVRVKAVSPWRYVGLWLSLVLGMVLGLGLSGQGHLVMNPYSPLLLTLGCAALLGLSAICLWGLPVIFPLACLGHAWLHDRDRWWRLLPAMLLLMALLSAVGVPLSGQQLPGLSESSFWESSAVPSDADLEAAYAFSVQAWVVCARASGIILLLVALHILVCCGCGRTWCGVMSYYRAIGAASRSLRDASVAQERRAASERRGEMPADEESSGEMPEDREV